MTVFEVAVVSTREALSVGGVSRAIDRIEVIFDDETSVADAGSIVPATLMVRLGLEAVVNQTVRLVGCVGGALPGPKILTLVAAILAGGSRDRSRRHVAGGRDGRGVAVPGHGALDVGHVPAGLHLRPRPSGRRRDR